MKNTVNEMRKKRGMSVAELARRSNTSRQTIYAIENQKIKRVSGVLMFSIAESLDCGEREIFFQSL